MRTTLVPISHGTCSCKVSPMLPSFHFPPHSATRIKALEEGLPRIRDRFKSKADKNDITKVKKMISELELTMENVGAGSRVKCISCDRVSNRR
mmetsp:Transcript_8326/g.22168  ORF Transcript_8326/g.22168 Transcript_8326/m.22168 type:complete len:93 (+) Transcript_8326:1703-1981(+)